MTKINLDALKKSLAILQEALCNPLLEDKKQGIFIRDAVVQRFEYTYEICRNLIRKILEQEFEERNFTVKGSYRLAGRYGMIDNVEKWFQYHDARNMTARRYEEAIAIDTFLAAKEFAQDAAKLIQNLTKILDDKTK
jgi:nucleotidyltransferase substrate binding protein (TIGR01987 family)